jgi:hypothetical protein
LPDCWPGAPTASTWAPFEQGEIGPDLFKAACDMMLEGHSCRSAGTLRRQLSGGMPVARDDGSHGGC